MVDTVAYQVRQGVDNAFNKAFIEFSGLAFGCETNLLAQLGCRFPDNTRKAAEHVIHGHHAN